MKCLKDFDLGIPIKHFKKGDEFPVGDYTKHSVDTFIKMGWIGEESQKETKDTPKKMKTK